MTLNSFSGPSSPCAFLSHLLYFKQFRVASETANAASHVSLIEIRNRKCESCLVARTLSFSDSASHRPRVMDFAKANSESVSAPVACNMARRSSLSAMSPLSSFFLSQSEMVELASKHQDVLGIASSQKPTTKMTHSRQHNT